jgi:hypothetical protein
MDDIEQANNVGVSHLLEERDFADGGTGDTFIFSFEADLLQGDNSTAIGKVSSFVDNTVGTWKVSALGFREGEAGGVKITEQASQGLPICTVSTRTFTNLFQLLVVLHGR